MVLGTGFWNEKVVPQALQSDFLMHAVLATAASHMRALVSYKEGERYQRMVFQHFGESLRLFREALQTLNAPASSLISCAGLLLHYSWTAASTHSDSGELSEDGLLPLASGLQYLINKMKLHIHPTFIDLLGPFGPYGTVVTYAKRTILVDEVGKDMLLQYSKLPTRSASEPEDLTVFSRASQGLAPVLAILQSKSSATFGEIEADTQAYLFTWPAQAERELKHLFMNHYDAAQLLFLYYYDAASRLFREDCWWSKPRATILCKTIAKRLEGKCDAELLQRLSGSPKT